MENNNKPKNIVELKTTKPQEGKNIGLFEATMRGLKPEVIGNSSFVNNVYLESDEDIKNFFIKSGITDENYINRQIGELKSNYESIKTQKYDVAARMARGVQMTNDEFVGDIGTITQVPVDLYYRTYNSGKAKVKYANDYSYLDMDSYFTQEADGSLKKHELSKWERMFDPSYMVGKAKDDMGNPTGLPMIMKVDPTKLHYGEYKPLHVFGDSDVWGSSPVFDGIAGLVSGAVPTTLKTIAQIVSVIDTVEEQMYSAIIPRWEEITGNYEGNSPLGEMANYGANWLEKFEYQPSDQVKEGGFFGSYGSFMYSFGNGLGQLVPQLALAYATGGISVVAQATLATAAKAALNQVGKEAAKMILKKSLMKTALKSSQKFALVGTIQATGANYQEMISSGYSQEKAANIALALSPVINITEKTLASKWLPGKLGVGEFVVAIEGAMKKSIGQMAKNQSSKLATDAGKKEFIKAFSKEAIKNFKKAPIKSTIAGVKGAAKNTMAVPKHVKDFMKATGKTLDDWETKWFWSRGNPISIVKAAGYEGFQESLEQALYIGGFYAGDNAADDSATIGNGLMGYKYLKRDVLSEKTWDELKENFWAGNVLGGFASGVAKTRKNNITDENYLFYAGSTGQLEDVKFSYFQKRNEYFGSADINPDMQIIKGTNEDNTYATVADDIFVTSPKGEKIQAFKKGQELKSVNDLNLYNALIEADYVQKLINDQGFTPEHATKFTGAEGIMLKGHKAFKNYSQAKQQIETLNEQLKDENLNDDQKATIKAELEKAQKSMVGYRNEYEYLMKPDNEGQALQEKVEYLKSQNEAYGKELEKEGVTEEGKKSILEKIDTNNILIDKYGKDINDVVYDKEGYSKAYKDNLKNSLALMASSNKFAAESLEIDKKAIKTNDGKWTLKEKDVKKFMGLREKYISAMADTDIYSMVNSIETNIDIAIAKNRVMLNNNKFNKEEQDKAITSLNEIKGNIKKAYDEMVSESSNGDVRKEFEAKNKGMSSIFDEINKLNKAVDFNTSGVATAVKDIFSEVDSLLGDVDDFSSMGVGMDFIQSDEGEYEQQQVEEASKLNTLFTSMYSGKISKFRDSYSGLQSKVDLEEKQERLRGMSDLEIRDYIIYDNIEQELKGLESKDEMKENLLEVEKRLVGYLSMLGNLDYILDLRKDVINPLSENKDDNKFLSKQDRTITKEDYDKYTTLNKQLKTKLREQLDNIASQKKANANYFVLDRINKVHMNFNALTLLFDNAKFKAAVYSNNIKNIIDGIDLPKNTDPTTIDEDTKLKLEKAERAINEVFEIIHEKRDTWTNEEFLYDILKNSFMYNMNNSKDISFLGNVEYDVVDKTTAEMNARKYGEVYNGDSVTKMGMRLSYEHFVNVIIKLGSDISMTELNKARHELYLDEKIVSSTEQIYSEDATIAFLLGGNKVFDTLIKTEQRILKEESRADFDRYYKPNIMFLTGQVQTGKTQQMTPQIIKLLNKLGVNKSIVFISFSKESRDTFANVIANLGEAGKNAKIVTSKEYIEGNYKDTIAFWDEASLTTNDEKIALDEIVKDNLIVFMGDASQMPDLVGKINVNSEKVPYDIMRVGFRTTPPIKKFATDNPMLMELMDYRFSLISKSKSNQREAPIAFSEEVDGFMRGIKYNKNIDDVIKDFLDRIKSGNFGVYDIGLVFFTEKQADQWLTKYPELRNHIQYVSVLSVDKNNSSKVFDTIQGARRKEVYIAYDGSSEQTQDMYDIAQVASIVASKALYTLAGRASSYVNMPGDTTLNTSQKPSNFISTAEKSDSESTRKEMREHLSNIYDFNSKDENKTHTATSASSNTKTPEGEERGVTKAQNATKAKLDKLVSLSNEKQFKDSGKQRKDKNGKDYERVTNVVGPEGTSLSEVMDFHRNMDRRRDIVTQERLDKTSNIGKGIDSIARDFFNNKVDKWDSYKIGNTNSNVFKTEEKFNEFIDKYLTPLRKEIEKNGDIIYSVGEFTIYSDLLGGAISGQMDLITITKNGKVKIYDYKAKSNYSTKDIQSVLDKVIKSVDYLFGKVSPEESYQRQLSAYADILENMDPDIHVDDELTIVYVGYYSSKDSDNVTNVNTIIPVKVKRVETNITKNLKQIEEVKQEFDEQDNGLSVNEIRVDNKKIKVGKTYDTTVGEQEVLDIIKYKEGKVIVKTDNGDFDLKEFKNIIVTKKPKTKVEVSDVDKSGMFAESAKIFASNGAFYSTPVTIDKKTVEALNLSLEEIEMFRAIKGHLMQLMAGIDFKIIFHKSRENYNDETRSYKNYSNTVNLAPDIKDEQFIQMLLNVKIGKEVINKIVDYYQKNKSLPEGLTYLLTLTNPEIEYPTNGKANSLELTGSNLGDVISTITNGFRNGGLTDSFRDFNIEYNIAKAKLIDMLINNGKEGAVFSNTNVIIPSNIQGHVTYGGTNVPLSEFIAKEEKRGFKFDLSKIKPITTLNKKHLIVLPFSFNNGKMTGQLDVTTPFVSQDKALFISELKSAKITSKVTDPKTVNSLIDKSKLLMFLRLNKAFTESLYNNKDVQNIIYNKNGFPEFSTRTKNVPDRLQSQINNYNTLIDYIIDSLNKGTSVGLSIEQKTRVPYEYYGDKLSDIVDKLSTNAERINIPYTYTQIEFQESKNNNNSNFEDDAFSIMDSNKEVIPVKIEEAKSIISNILGDTAANEWTDFIPNLNANGLNLFGMMKNGRLQYRVTNGNVNKRTIRHEIFHLVYRYFISEESQQRVLNEARAYFKNSSNMTDLEIEEKLSDWHGDNGENYRKDRYQGFLGKLRMLVDKIFGRYQMYSGELNALLSDIEQGKFKSQFNEFASKGYFNDSMAFSVIDENGNLEIPESLKDDNKNAIAKDKEATSAIITVLGSTNRLETAVKILSREVLKQSIYANGKKTFIDAIRFIMNDYDVSHYGEKKVKSVGLLMKNIKPEHLLKLKPNELSGYIGYNLSINPDFKRGLIKASFPDFNFDAKKFHKTQHSTQYDNKKSLALGTSMNQLIKFYFSSVPLFENALRKDQEFKGEFVDIDKAMSILYEAGYKYSSMKKSGNSIKDFKEALKSVRTRNRSYHNDNVNSILMKLFDEPGAKPSIDDKYFPSLQRVSDSKNYKQWERQDATDLLTGIISFFGSSENNNLIDVKIGNKFDTVENKGKKNFDSIVDNIKRTINRSVYDLDSMSIKEDLVDMYTKAFNENSIYSFESDGIKINGQYFIQKNSDGNYDFVGNSIDKKNLQNALVMTGLTSIKGKVIRAMTITNKHEKVKDSVGNNDEWFDYYELTQRQLLATAIAVNMYTIKTGIDQEKAIMQLKKENPTANQSDFDKVLAKSFTYKKELESEMNRVNMKYELSEDGRLVATNVDSLYYIGEDKNKEERIEIKAVKPSDYFKMIQVIGQIVFQEENARAENMLFAAGKKVWTVEKRNHILSMFNMQDNFDSDRDRMKNIINEDIIKSNSNDVIIQSQNGRINNSFFDNSAAVNRVSLLPGLSNDYKSSDSFTHQDEFNTHMAIFLDSFKKTQAKGRSTFTIPLGYNERKYSVNVSFNNGFVKFQFKNSGTIKSVAFDNEKYIEQIKKVFNYYYASAAASHNRWSEFMANSNSDIFKADEFKKYFEKPNNETNYSEYKGIQFKISDEAIVELQSSGLKNQLDYYISTNKDGEKIIGFGNALRFTVYNTSAISYENYLKLKDYNSYVENRNVQDKETKKSPNEEFLNQIFKIDMANDFKRNKPYLFNSEARWGIDKFYESEAKSAVTNPVLRAQYLTMFVTNSMLTQIVYGNPQGSKNDSDYFKRNNPTKTGKTTPIFGTRKGLNKIGKAIVISSKIDTRTDEMLNGETVNSFDGQTIGFVFHYIGLMNSLGGKEYSQFNKTMVKPLTSGANAATGIQTQLKQAVDYYSGREISKHRKLYNMQMNLVSIWNRDVQRGILEHNATAYNEFHTIDNPIDLVEMINQYLEANDYDFEKAAIQMWDVLMDDSKETISDIKQGYLRDVIKNNIPMGFSDKEVIKTGLSNINFIDPTILMDEMALQSVSSILHDNEKYGIVNNPFQAIDKDSTVAVLNQVISHMGVGSHNKAEASRIAKAMTNIQDLSEKELFEEMGVSEDIDSWTEKDINNFRNFLRESGISSLMNMRTGNAVLDMLENGASLDIPLIAETLKTTFRNMRNERALKPRFKGYRANQSSGAYHEFFETADGSVFTYDSARKKFSNFEAMLQDGSLKVRELNYMHIENGKHVDSEVVAPYMYRGMFNIRESEDVADVYTIETTEGSAPLMGTIRNIIEQYGDRSVTKLTDAIYQALEGSYMTDNAVLRNIYRNTPEYRQSAAEGIKITKDIASQMAKYFIKFDKSLEVVINRVPYDTPALGFVARIVSFTEGNGNTIYINPLENIRTGGDQDIDQLSVYFSNFDENGFVKDESTVKGNQNVVLDSVKEFYRNPLNKDVVYGTTGTKVLEGVVEEIRKKDSSIRKRNITPMSSFSSILKLSELAEEGDGGIGIFALSASAYAYMLTSMDSRYVGERIFLTNRRKSTHSEMVARMNVLSSFLQAALDNQKVMILGDMNIPQKASGLVVALSAFGMTEQQIGDLFTSDAMSYVLYKIRESSNIDEKSIYIPELITNQLDYFTEQKTNNEKLLTEIYGNISKEVLAAKRDENQRNIFYIDEMMKDEKSDKNTLYENQQKLEDINEKIDFILNYSSNISTLNLVYDASVYGEAMRRFGQVVSLRNGIRTKSYENLIHHRQLELSLGMDLNDYMNSNEDITEEQFMNYYKNHSNNYRKSDNKELLEKIESDVFNALQLGNFVKSNPYFMNLLGMVNSDSKMWNKTFYGDNEVFQQLEKEVMELQNRNYAEYPNQLFDINQIATEMLLDVYLKQKTAEGLSFNLSIPNHESLEGSNDIFNNTKLGTREDQQLFMLRFPYMIDNIKSFMLNENNDNQIIQFMENFGFEEDIDPSVFKDNKFFDLINIDGYEGFARIYALEGNDSNNTKKLQIFNDFMKLPKELRTMFQIYAALQNKLQYKSKGIDPFVGVDLMIDISKTVNFDILPSKLNMTTAIDHVGARDSIRRHFKPEDPVTFTYKITSTKNTTIRRAARFRGTLEGTTPDLDIMTFVVPNAIYDTAAETMWYPDIQQIKLDHKQEARMRSPILSNPSVTRKFLTGSSFTNGVGITGTGMVVSISPNTNGTEVTVRKYTGDIDKVIEKNKASASEKLALLKLGNETLRNNLINGNQSVFFIRNADFQKGIFTGFRSDSVIGSIFNVQGTSTDLQNTSTLEITYVGKFNKEQLIAYAKNSDKRLEKQEAIDKWIFNKFGIESYEDIYKENVIAHFYTSKVISSQDKANRNADKAMSKFSKMNNNNDNEIKCS